MNGSLSDPLESLKAAGQRQRNAAFNQPLTQNGNGNTNGHQQVIFFYILQCFLLALGFYFSICFSLVQIKSVQEVTQKGAHGKRKCKKFLLFCPKAKLF